ncbi:MAG TPA: DUF2341 domain-containing protein, partial [Thermoplasmatales archaeon]|nr:DUF2341 domain-containing protein [Thermoplasmatales archaeon]
MRAHVICKRSKAVSHVVGYILTFVVISMATATIIYTTSMLVESRVNSVTEVVAQDIANYVVDAITEALAVKQTYPLASYSCTVDIPRDINGKSYYIDITDSKVYVNTTDGVSVSSTLYGQEKLAIGVRGFIWSGGGDKLRISVNKTSYIYKLDFGVFNSETSPGMYGYTRVSKTSSENYYDENGVFWWDDAYIGWLNRATLYVRNDNTNDLYNYQVRVDLYPDNFDYRGAQRDGSDIRFTNASGVSLPYWIESWEFLGHSIVWFKADYIPGNDTAVFYMYYGNASA